MCRSFSIFPHSLIIDSAAPTQTYSEKAYTYAHRHRLHPNRMQPIWRFPDRHRLVQTLRPSLRRRVAQSRRGGSRRRTRDPAPRKLRYRAPCLRQHLSRRLYQQRLLCPSQRRVAQPPTRVPAHRRCLIIITRCRRRRRHTRYRRRFNHGGAPSRRQHYPHSRHPRSARPRHRTHGRRRRRPRRLGNLSPPRQRDYGRARRPAAGRRP